MELVVSVVRDPVRGSAVAAFAAVLTGLVYFATEREAIDRSRNRGVQNGQRE